MGLRAQIFISCGQREDLGEIEIAHKIATILDKEGFEPYVATKQQTLQGLKENIFNRLAESEYFLFVDFRREQIQGNTNPDCYRGSVFSQQELAVAAHQDIEVIAFQEEGVRPLEGILAYMQANCIRFNNARVLEIVKDRGWSSNWKNSLSIEAEVSVQRDVLRLPENVHADFYHLLVRNNHLKKTARNVYGYLERVTDLKTGARVDFEAAEFKWAGYILPNATIPPERRRKLDAFWLPYTNPNNPQFNAFTDSTQFIPRLRGPGEWKLEYSVISDTVRGASRHFRLHLDGTVSGGKITAI
jgi:hypothetical protein